MKNKTILTWVIVFATFILSLLACLKCGAQSPTRETVPAYESRDWYVWYVLYYTEHSRAEGLEESGHAAISGLQEELSQANGTIVSQNSQIVSLAKEVDDQRNRAEQLALILADRPKTKLGRFLKSFSQGVRIAVPSAIAGVLVGVLVPR